MIEYFFYIAALIPLFLVLYLFASKFITKFRFIGKKAIFYLKIIILVPFWCCFLYFSLLFLIPELSVILKNSDSSQKITIENTDDSKLEFLVIGRLFRTNTWQPVYSSTFDFSFSPIISIENSDIYTKTINTGKNHFDIISIIMISNKNYQKDSIKALAYSVPSQPIKVYSHQFLHQTKFEKVPIDAISEIILFVLSFTAFLGVIYHLLSTRGKLWFTIPMYLIYTTVIITSLLVLYSIGQLLLYLHLP